MTILGLCFDASATGAGQSHNPGLVILSFIVALFASYSALDMAERLRGAEGQTRAFWLAMSGLTLGAGIWSMHFVGMTAFDAPMEQGYDLGLTLLSGVIAITAVTAGLWLMGRKTQLVRLGAGGLVVGAGVVAMHYVGMSALDVPGQIVYRPSLFGLSVLIALTAATAALWLAATVTRMLQRVLAACVMAVAICGMHYTAMSGTQLILAPIEEAAHTVVSKGLLAAIVAVGVSGLLTAGLLMAFLDRRMEAHSMAEAQRLLEVNAALEQARADAEAASAVKSQFLATMSHEIRTPMNGVLGMLEAVLRTPMDADQRDQLATARESAASLLHILNDILDYSKIEAGQLTLEAIPFNPGQMVDEVISTFASQASAKGIFLDALLMDDRSGWLVGDPTRVRQVLANLVSNAIKFTEIGGVSVSLSYDPIRSGGRIRFEVRDTGIGISEAARHNLFKRFSQADASTTRRFGGTGLGLAICHELAGRMGGELGVDSVAGKGSCFWFSLPARISDEPVWREARSTAGPLSADNLNILVAEDNLINQKVLRALLAPQSHKLTFVCDGAEALEAMKTAAFDLVLMDVHMPVMDGPTATGAIRKLPGLAGQTPIIALTANAMAGDREAYLAAGMNDYVSKPIDSRLLNAAMARQCPHAAVPAPVLAPQSDAEGAEDMKAGAAADAAIDDICAGLDDIIACLGAPARAA